jgi:hypothetical protein
VGVALKNADNPNDKILIASGGANGGTSSEKTPVAGGTESGFTLWLGAAEHFDYLSFAYLGSGSTLSVTVFDRDGLSTNVGEIVLNGQWSTAGLTLDATRFGLIDHIVFSNTFNDFGIDNISFDLKRSPVTDVPEPAGYGLVALALLGAGLASRRRKA